MKKNDNKPETQSSSPPTRPPKPPIVAVGTIDSGGENSKTADYGCHEALWALSRRYRDSDIHGAHSALVEQEKLLREHIRFPSYRFQLVLTMAMRSEIVSRLGDEQAASDIMADALHIFRDEPGGRSMTSDFLLKLIRELDKRANVKWRQGNQDA